MLHAKKREGVAWGRGYSISMLHAVLKAGKYLQTTGYPERNYFSSLLCILLTPPTTLVMLADCYYDSYSLCSLDDN